MSTLRIQKYLADCGLASRRRAEELIADGQVVVNGKKAKIGQKIDPEQDRVEVRGKRIAQTEAHVYIALNKPSGYISSCSDTQGPSLLQLVDTKEKIFPVGRLDKDSEGLIILTNDGELANQLTHPRYGCEKEYLVGIDRIIEDEEIDKLRRGVVTIECKTQPCKINRKGPQLLSFILQEGKKRQLRLMLKAVGCRVVYLKRTRIKNLSLGSLKPGEWRFLTSNEIFNLKKPF